MTDDDLPDDLIVSMPASAARVVVTGSTTDTCLECGQAVVVSPDTRRATQAGVIPDYIICIPCLWEHEGRDAFTAENLELVPDVRDTGGDDA